MAEETDQLTQDRILEVYRLARSYARKKAWRIYHEELIDEFPAYAVERLIRNNSPEFYARNWFIDYTRLQYGRDRKVETNYPNQHKLDFWYNWKTRPDNEIILELIGKNCEEIEKLELIECMEKHLPKKQFEIVYQRIFEGKTTIELGKKYKMTPARITQIMREAVKKMNRR